jgi:hypothetical protein
MPNGHTPALLAVWILAPLGRFGICRSIGRDFNQRECCVWYTSPLVPGVYLYGEILACHLSCNCVCRTLPVPTF